MLEFSYIESGLFTLQSVFTHVATIFANLLEQRIWKDLFATSTWPPFHCFGTPCNTSAVTSCENDLYQLHNIEKKKCKTFLAYKLYLSHLSGSCQVFCPFYLLSLVLGVLFWVCCITFNIWRATRGDRAKRLERSVSDSFLNASKGSIYKPNFSLHYLFIGTIIWSPGAFR